MGANANVFLVAVVTIINEIIFAYVFSFLRKNCRNMKLTLKRAFSWKDHFNVFGMRNKNIFIVIIVDCLSVQMSVTVQIEAHA